MADIPFQIEAWVEYGIGVLILFVRFFARWKTVGFQGRKGDDYFAIAALIFWTVSVTMSLPPPKCYRFNADGAGVAVTRDSRVNRLV